MFRVLVPSVPIIALVAVCGALGAGVVAARAAAESPEGQDEPPQLRLEVPRRAGTDEGPLDWVFENVDTGRDGWTTERIHEELGARLEALRERLLEPGSGAEEVLLDSFRGETPLPTLESRESFGDGTIVRAPARRESDSPSTGGDSGAGRLSREAWLRELDRLSSACGRLAKAKLKTFQVRRASERGVATRVLVELDGVADRPTQARCVWDLEWTAIGDSWRIAGARVVSIELASMPRRPFSDVTTAALGHEVAWRDQLVHGVGYWRTRIDSASGIDVYGHQGVAVGDYDGDGVDDFYVPQPAGLPNRLFRGLGDGRFEELARRAGVDVLDVTGGALFVDLDGDGDPELVLATSLEVLLFENLGDGSFRRRERSGVEASHDRRASTLGLAAADFDLDGDVDLYVFSYIFWAGGGSTLHSSYPWPYHDANNGAPNFLLRNDGDLRFTDVTRASGMDVNNRRFSLAASWGDYDDDGDPDLYVANDFGRNNLYRNEGGGRFRDVAAELGVEDTGNGMSVTWEDYDNDGRLDLYVGNMWSSAGNRIAAQPAFEAGGARDLYLRMSRGNSLFRNLGGRFEDVSIAAGAEFGRWAWSCRFVDVEGDGHEDLYVANGFITNERHDDL